MKRILVLVLLLINIHFSFSSILFIESIDKIIFNSELIISGEIIETSEKIFSKSKEEWIKKSQHIIFEDYFYYEIKVKVKKIYKGILKQEIIKVRFTSSYVILNYLDFEYILNEIRKNNSEIIFFLNNREKNKYWISHSIINSIFDFGILDFLFNNFIITSEFKFINDKDIFLHHLINKVNLYNNKKVIFKNKKLSGDIVWGNIKFKRLFEDYQHSGNVGSISVGIESKIK